MAQNCLAHRAKLEECREIGEARTGKGKHIPSSVETLRSSCKTSSERKRHSGRRKEGMMRMRKKREKKRKNKKNKNKNKNKNKKKNKKNKI